MHSVNEVRQARSRQRSRAVIRCSFQTLKSHSGGFRSPLSQLSACLMGSSLSHVSHMYSVPAGVVLPFSGPLHFGHLLDGSRRGMVFKYWKSSSVSVL